MRLQTGDFAKSRQAILSKQVAARSAQFNPTIANVIRQGVRAGRVTRRWYSAPSSRPPHSFGTTNLLRGRVTECRQLKANPKSRSCAFFRLGHFFSKSDTRRIKLRVSKTFASALRLLCATAVGSLSLPIAGT